MKFLDKILNLDFKILKYIVLIMHNLDSHDYEDHATQRKHLRMRTAVKGP